MTINTGDKVWSINGEDFIYDSLEELIGALDDDDDLEVGRVVEFGIAHKPAAADFICADAVIYHMQDAAYAEVGDHAPYFPDVSAEEKRELDDFLKAWANKYCAVDFFMIRDTQEYTITVDDVKTNEIE